jgi:hypothetical protein
MINPRWRWDESDQSLDICNCDIDQRQAGIADRLAELQKDAMEGRKHSIFVNVASIQDGMRSDRYV